MEFSRQEYWSGWSFLSLGNLPNPGIKPRSPILHTGSLSSQPVTTFCWLTQISISSLEDVLWPLKPLDPMPLFLGMYAGASHRNLTSNLLEFSFNLLLFLKVLLLEKAPHPPKSPNGNLVSLCHQRVCILSHAPTQSDTTSCQHPRPHCSDSSLLCPGGRWPHLTLCLLSLSSLLSFTHLVLSQH